MFSSPGFRRLILGLAVCLWQFNSLLSASLVQSQLRTANSTAVSMSGTERFWLLNIANVIYGLLFLPSGYMGDAVGVPAFTICGTALAAVGTGLFAFYESQRYADIIVPMPLHLLHLAGSSSGVRVILNQLQLILLRSYARLMAARVVTALGESFLLPQIFGTLAVTFAPNDPPAPAGYVGPRRLAYWKLACICLSTCSRVFGGILAGFVASLPTSVQVKWQVLFGLAVAGFAFVVLDVGLVWLEHRKPVFLVAYSMDEKKPSGFWKRFKQAGDRKRHNIPGLASASLSNAFFALACGPVSWDAYGMDQAIVQLENTGPPATFFLLGCLCLFFFALSENSWSVNHKWEESKKKPGARIERDPGFIPQITSNGQRKFLLKLFIYAISVLPFYGLTSAFFTRYVCTKSPTLVAPLVRCTSI